jgi:hypothetical protein
MQQGVANKNGSSWNRVGKIGVSGREHARARKRERTRKSVVTRPEVGLADSSWYE